MRNSQGPKPPVTERIAGWSARHRVIVVFGWFLLVVVVFFAGQAHGTSSKPAYDPGRAGQAEHTLQKLTNDGGIQPSENVLISERGGGAKFADNPAMQAAARDIVSALTRLPKAATNIQSPLTPAGSSLIAPDGRSALVSFTVPGTPSDVGQNVQPAVSAVARVQTAHPGLTIAEAGDASINYATSQALGKDFRKAESTSVPITLILMLLVFGALIAAGIPVLLAITAVATVISLLALLSGVVPVSTSTSEVVVVVGMAVGVDYSLFYLRREREERAAGRSVSEALRIAAGTSGRAVLVSGITVMLAMAGLFLTGIDEFTGVALGTILVVGVAVIGSVTVLPALLSLLGRRADRGRIPWLGRRRAAARPSRAWGALARSVVKRPVIWGGAALIALLALASPALGMRLGYPAVDAPAGIPEIHTLAEIQSGFRLDPWPAEIVVTGSGLTSPRTSAAITALRQRAAGEAAHGGAIGEPVTVTVIHDTAAPDGAGALLIEVPLAGSGTDTASYQGLGTLESKILPATLGKVPGISYAITGDTASDAAFTKQLHDRMAWVFVAVGILAFVLLLIAFRSLVIPVVSILLNVLSVAAAYGLITLIFQDGRFQGALGYTSFGGIISWVPLFMFVFLFGIGMDYHVFILSRIREHVLRGSTPREAVTEGIATSAGVVTSAALIMVAVFSIFATLSLVDLKILGVGTAAAVLIDATVVRGILVPAVLSLLGDRAWNLRDRQRTYTPKTPVLSHRA